MMKTVPKKPSKVVGGHETTSSSSSWRSQGWCPLSYPVSKAFFSITQMKNDPFTTTPWTCSTNTTINSFFPLHKNVLLATVRELLILDGAISASSLQVLLQNKINLNQSKSDRNKRKRDDVSSIHEKEDDIQEIKSIMEYQKKHNQSWPTSAEDLALDLILQSSWNHKISESTSVTTPTLRNTLPSSGKSIQTAMVTTSHLDRIRKVSDAEEEGYDHNLSPKQHHKQQQQQQQQQCVDDGMNQNTALIDVLRNNHPNQQILPQYIVILDNIRSGNILVKDKDDEETEKIDKAQRFVWTQKVETMEESKLLDMKSSLPEFLDLSIMVEEYLRKVTFHMVSCLVQNISDEALREFLGYKSSMLKKQDALQLVADVLFDVSHALFAWEQTECDLYGHDPSNNTASFTDMDSHICKMLFDARSLRKIGGFEPSSLLLHALSIGRLRSKNTSWADHRMTEEGKNLFAHHENREARLNAGLLRRSKRRKMNHSIKPLEISDNGGMSRLRSCSLASDAMDMTHESDPSIGCGVVSITIRRKEGETWGILLAKEGTICVVMRAPVSSNASLLQVGDLIVSATNEHGEKAPIPTNGTLLLPGWFTETTSLFKKSLVMHLEVRNASQKRFNLG